MDNSNISKWLNSAEYDKRLSERLQVQQSAINDTYQRHKVLLQCADSPIFFLNNFGWVHEPRHSAQPDVEMFLFPHQEDFLLDIIKAEEAGEDRLWEKSRDMGLSWAVVGYYLWRWMFSNGWIGLYGSRKQEDVDNKMVSSFMGKVRYMQRRLPNFFTPEGFKRKLHDTENRFLNPSMNSLILGESANPNFGRARRSSIAVLDEIFYQEYGQDAWRALAETCRCRVGISTPKRTRFARTLRESMQTNKWLRTLHWKQHPFKDAEWYEKTKKRYIGDEVGLKTELELEYADDPELLVYPQAELIPLDNIPYVETAPIYVSIDWGVAASKTAILWWQQQRWDKGTRWVLLEALVATDKPVEWYIPFLKPTIDKPKDLVYKPEEEEVLEKVKKWREPLAYYGEAAHYAKAATSNTSIAQELAKRNVILRYNPQGISHERRQLATKKMIAMGMAFNDTFYTKRVLDDMSTARFPATKGIKEKVAPIHDDTADTRSAVENMAVNVQAFDKMKSFAYDKRYR